MAKRRTKDQKRRTAERKVEQRMLQSTKAEFRTTVSEPISTQTPLNSNQAATQLAEVLAKAGQHREVKSEDTASAQRLFGFDVRLLYRDLTKTIITSLVILVLLVVFSRLSF